MASNRVREVLHTAMVSRQQNELELWTTLAAGNFAPRVDFPAAYAGQVCWEFNGQIYPATSGASIAAPALGGMQRAVLRGVPLSEITRLESSSFGLQGDLTNFRPERFRSMVTLYLNSNSFTGDLSGWVIPSTMVTLYLYSNSFTGDLSGWVLPSTLARLSLSSNSFTGDLSGWVIPSTMVTLYLNSNSFTGDLSGWVIPSTMVTLYLYSNSFTGDLSGWVIPSAMVNLSLSSNSFRVFSTFAGVGAGMRDFQIQNCSLPQPDVDNVIESLWTARAGFSYVAPALNIGGTNLAPSGTYAAPSEGADWHEDAPGHWTPLTGKAMVYDLQNDVNSEGFNTWTVTYTA